MNRPTDLSSPEAAFFSRLKRQELERSLPHKNELWQKIAAEAHKRQRSKRRRLWLSVASVAAVLMAAVLISREWWAESPARDDGSMGVEELMACSFSELKEVTLIRHNKEIVATSSHPTIVHLSGGAVQMDGMEVRIGTEKRWIPPKGAVEYNMVIVPKGKQAVLTLNDGSKIRINARTKVIYPERFSDQHREIYVDGEAYLDVTHNPTHPFRVKTSRFEVNVLGTSFNVTAYRELSSSMVALVDGSVRVSADGQNIPLTPSQVVTIVDGKIGTPHTTDLSPYLGWIDGLIYLQSTPIDDLFNRMSFHYGIPFEWADGPLQLGVSGKLDISRDLSSSLNYLSQILPIRFTRYENKILVNSSLSR